MAKLCNLDDRLPAPCAENVNWWTVADWFTTKRCDSSRAVGYCGCSRGRGANRYCPCDLHETMADECKSLGRGEPAGRFSIEAIRKWAWLRTCNKYRNQGRTCNHKACHQAEAILNFLDQQARRKAA